MAGVDPGQGGRGLRLVIEGPDAQTVARLLFDLAARSVPQAVVAAPAPALEPLPSAPAAPAPTMTTTPATPARPQDSAHVAWAQLREAWLTECGLPASKCTALDSQAFLTLNAMPGAPRIDALLSVLRREAPKWHAGAADARSKGDPDPWAKTCPSVRTWLAKRPWELAADPVPRAPGERPKAPPEVLAYVEDLRRKADRAQRVGDHALATDYRRQIDRALTTGAIP